MVKKLVALDLLNTILSKVYTKITNETNEKIELATKGYDNDTFIPLTQKAAANGVATLDANGHVPVEQIVDTTDETGDEFDYLSINDTGFEWKSRVHNDYTNANPNNLIDSDTLRNYNGQWKSGEPVPADTHDFSFSDNQAPEEVVANIDAMNIFGTPVITESEDKVYPDDAESWKRWTYTPTGSYTIYTTDSGFIKEIKELHVECFVQYDYYQDVSVVVIDSDDVEQTLTENLDYSIVSTSSIQSVETISVTGDMSEDVFKNTLLATGLFEEVEGEIHPELHPTQTIFLSDEHDKGSFGTNAYLTHFEGDSYLSVFVNGDEYTFSGDTVLSAIKTTPATTVNPITKLGVVDEGTWVAGDVTTPHLVANESTVLNKTTTINNDLHITEKVLDFGGTNYDVWDYANDNMNWVEE